MGGGWTDYQPRAPWGSGSTAVLQSILCSKPEFDPDGLSRLEADSAFHPFEFEKRTSQLGGGV